MWYERNYDQYFFCLWLWKLLLGVEGRIESTNDHEDYEKLARGMESASPLEIMDKAFEKFGNDIAIAFRYMIFIYGRVIIYSTCILLLKEAMTEVIALRIKENYQFRSFQNCFEIYINSMISSR